MTEQIATPEEMNRFVRVVDQFMKNYTELVSPVMRQKVYSTNDSALISDYESAVNRGRVLKSTIENTVGAWNAAKAAWSSVTDTTSIWIGDAIDEIKSWFGGGPDMSGLGFIQLPAAAWIAGIIAVAYSLNSLMSNIFVRANAAKLVEQGVSPERALATAKQGVASQFFQTLNVPLLVGGVLAVWLLFMRKN